MRIANTVQEMRAVTRAVRAAGKSLGLVPTMGALHPGHLSLVRAAKTACGSVTVSIFVNPLQFGPQEDLAKYPRDFEGDAKRLEAEGVDCLFAPSVEEMFPEAAVTYVEVKGLSQRLCGGSRPGHFRGVATVVAKLFHMIEADRAFFGQKDAAQVAVLRRMVRDLNFPVEIVVCPIVREADGLAMSSRNAYLNPQERTSALELYRALKEVERRFAQGERNPSNLVEAGKLVLAEDPAVRLDYFSVVDPDTLLPVSKMTGKTLVAVAAFVGSTRLLDNIVLVA